MKKISTVLCLFIAGLLQAQILEEETRILSEPNGDPLFKLNAGLALYSYEPEEGWYKVRREAWVGKEDLPDDKYLYPGTVLKNEEGEKIGEVLKEVKVKDKRITEGFRKEARVIVILEGYIFKTKIEEGSIPEQRISELLAVRNRTEQFEGFKELFDRYDFEERTFEDLTAYAMREQHKTADEEKDFRVIMVFRGETSPYAIITNDHSATAPKIKEEFDEPPFHVIYLYKPPASSKDLVENTILYTFLSL